ncbi:type 1 glutamine amidotransferase [Wenxinia saemankumensis]|uniref:GMP synthase (Glutamine-hydrolysing) n=1 Tax=Wenxinia saemankumensis TaxID=1447782 RepID=A0A1M6CFS7_9RHOB|nr:type 1 glutamine amidotransferase [Wenxinia saemankumensis]SHI59846.1 GMP synthase (glutamine-hydrolysing) [Wenxinia saemankumensis]
MHIGILQTGHAPDGMAPEGRGYDALFERLLAGQGFTFTTWNVVDMQFPHGPDEAEGWLVTGSRHGAYEDHPFIPPLEDLIRAIRDSRKPLVGICFGHQIIAQALGGTVEKFGGGWSVGRTEYDWGGETTVLNAWHQDQVTRLPEGASVLASSTFCAHAALLYEGGIFTVQAHPEFGREATEFLIEHRGPGTVPDALLEKAREGLDRPVDNARLAQMIGRFLRSGKLGLAEDAA